MDDMPSLSISRRHALVVVLGLAVAVLLVARWAARPATPSVRSASPVRVRAGPPVRPKLFVDVTGAVRRPGLYRLADGARVADALQRAGGTTQNALLESVNLAAPLVDGQQVLVPRKNAAPSGGVMDGAATAGPVSLSAATLEQLDTLPGIGPITAQKIIDYRNAHGAFHSVDDLDAVPGIGAARIEQLRDLVVP
jgi:competence protein ComEA